MTATDIRSIAAGWGMHLSDDEVCSYQELAAQLLDTIDQIGFDDEPLDVSTAARTGRRPSAGEDPLNAVVRWVDVPGREEGPLAGRCIAVKDSVAVAGVPMTCGSRLLQDFVPSEHSIVVERLLNAGARIVAVTTMDDMALSGSGDTSHYGPVINPFDSSRAAGGSSGGCAAILHYEGVDAAIGADQGGSIRVPAAWCGVVGLKPTYGLVPYTGVAGLDHTFDHVGPLAKTVDDTAAIMAALAGYDARDPRQQPSIPDIDFVAAVEAARDDLTSLRVGVVRQAMSAELGIDPDIIAETRRCAEQLRELGADVHDVDVAQHAQGRVVSTAVAMEGICALFGAGGNGYHWRGKYWPELATAVQRALPDAVDDLSAQVKIIMLLGEYLRRRFGGAVYGTAQNLRQQVTDAYDRALDDVDVLLMPTTPDLPHELLDIPPTERALRGWGVLANTTPANMTGHPAVSLPLGQVDQLPVGVMLVGKHFADGDLLRIAATCERRLGRKPTANVRGRVPTPLEA